MGKKKSDPSDKREKKTEEEGGKPRKAKKVRKSIYISHSSDAPFTEKRFIVDLVQQVKENNLADDIWFDKDEGVVDDPSWFSVRLETIDKCKAAVLLLSSSYLSCPVSLFESKILTEKITSGAGNVPKLFCILLEPVELPKKFAESLISANAELVDLTGELFCLSVEERTSYTVGALSGQLEKVASMKTKYVQPPPQSDVSTNDAWKTKRVINWSCADVVEWLYSIRVREFYRQAFAEKRVDGYLLLATSDHDLQFHLGIDSKIARKKISTHLVQLLRREEGLAGNWHLRCRLTRSRPNATYVIYDPRDARLASNIKSDLTRKGLQILSHEKLGQSREEFLELNGGTLAKCANTICLMTEAASTSPFVFHEILFCCWLGRSHSITTLLFSNAWNKLKTPIKATLGDCSAVDFETRLYSESMDILEHHVKPPQNITGIVLEQSFVEHMREGVKPLRALCAKTLPSLSPVSKTEDDYLPTAKAFISYQWDVQDKVDEIARYLDQNGFPCWSDIKMTRRSTSSRMENTRAISTPAVGSESLQGTIHRNMKMSSVVICCLTPKYVNCQNCEQDLVLAKSLDKPVIPILLQFVSWPPEGASDRIRRIMAQFMKPLDLSNSKLFRANLPHLLDKLIKLDS